MLGDLPALLAVYLLRLESNEGNFCLATIETMQPATEVVYLRLLKYCCLLTTKGRKVISQMRKKVGIPVESCYAELLLLDLGGSGVVRDKRI